MDYRAFVRAKLLFGRRYIRCFGLMRGVTIAIRSRPGMKARRSIRPANLHTPVLLRPSSSDLTEFVAIVLGDEYHVTLARRPEVIIDAGANIGLSSVLFANRYPNARIIAVEPNTPNFKLLVKNTSSYSQIDCVKGALWGNDEAISLMDLGRGHDAFQVTDSHLDPDGERVTGYTVGSLLDRFDIPKADLLKLDIEGAEIEVLSNSDQWLNRVDALTFELHDRFRPGCTQALQAALDPLGISLAPGQTSVILR